MSKILQQIADLVLPTGPAEFWALVAGVGTVVVMILAWQGLSSLGLTQRDMLTRATRDARQGAITRAEEWAREIIVMNGVILTLAAQHKVPVFVSSTSEVRFDPDNAADLEKAGKWCNDLPPEIYTNSLRLLNRMEAWAMYFTCGLADPKMAFGPCAPTFCSMIVQNYALLLLMRAQKSSGKYPNAVKLFKAWLHLLEDEERGLQRGDLLKRLRALQAKGPANAESLPDPIGTDIDTRRL